MIAGVPYDAEVEYLESAGTQWIDTGIPATDGYIFKADFMFTSLYSSYNYLAGSNSGSSNRIYFTRLDRSNGLFGMTYNTNPASVYAGVETGTRYSVETAAIRSNQYVKLDGTIVFTGTLNTAVNTGYNFYLFCASSSAAGATGNTAARIYSASFERDGVLVRDFIPVRVGQVGYMYDRVTRRLFGNAGTGAFVLGRDVATPVMGLRGYGGISAMSYVQDGLVAMWDGIENAGRGVHDPNATKWVNLAAPEKSFDWTNSENADGVAFSADNLYMPVKYLSGGVLAYAYNVTGLPESAPKTVEIVMAQKWMYTDSKWNLQSPFTLYSAIFPTSRNYLVSLFASWNKSMAVVTNTTGTEMDSWTPHSCSVSGVPGLGSRTLWVDGHSSTLNLEYPSDPSLNYTEDSARLMRTLRADSRIYSIRVYNRALTAEEIAHNYNIDKLRFNLGGAA